MLETQWMLPILGLTIRMHIVSFSRPLKRSTTDDIGTKMSWRRCLLLSACLFRALSPFIRKKKHAIIKFNVYSERLPLSTAVNVSSEDTRIHGQRHVRALSVFYVYFSPSTTVSSQKTDYMAHASYAAKSLFTHV